MQENSEKPVLYPIKPYHERLKAYKLARERIFCNSISIPEPPKKSKRNTLRKRLFCKQLKFKISQIRHCLDSLSSLNDDFRPFLQINLFGISIGALLDSGASISCLCGKAASKFLAKNIPYKKFNLSVDRNVETAGGNKFPIIGSFETDVTFRGQTKLIKFYIICLETGCISWCKFLARIWPFEIFISPFWN